MSFISVEGLDGSGTTTLVERLGEQYLDATLTTEPTDSEYGELLRRSLSDDERDPICDLFLFMSDRRHHIEQTVKPLAESGQFVISDRYADSTRAYQPVVLTDETDVFNSQWQAKMFIEKCMAGWLYEPDLTLYLSVSVETAIERSAGDEKFENSKMLEQVKQNYDAIAESNDRIVTIDGEKSIAQVADAAAAIIDRKF